MAEGNGSRRMDLDLAAAVFGPTAASFVVVVDRMTSAATVHTYDFMRNEDFRRLLSQDVNGAMQVYWREILDRAHFGACASLLRTRCWLEGVLAGFRDENYHTFMAAFRGWLEASADTFDAFQEIAAQLAEAHAVIRRAIMGRLDQITLWPDLENRLIHFSHARRIEKGEGSAPISSGSPSQGVPFISCRGVGFRSSNCRLLSRGLRSDPSSGLVHHVLRLPRGFDHRHLLHVSSRLRPFVDHSVL